MVSLDDAVLARLDSHGHRFEVYVDPDLAQEVRAGKEVDVNELLVQEEVFTDAHKGERASDEAMAKVFGTQDRVKAALEIVRRGEIHLTTEQRRRMQEAKRKQVVAIIVKHAINPQTGTPHPPTRIELAMEEARVHIDPFKPANQQVPAVLEALRTLIPIRFEKVNIAVRIPGSDYGPCYKEIKSYGKVRKEEWQKDGSWIGIVEIPAGVQAELFDRLNKRTKGRVEVRTLK